MTHGLQAKVLLADEAERIAADLKASLPQDDPAYDYAVDLAGLALARAGQYREYMSELEQQVADGEISRTELRERQLEADQGLNRVMRTGLALLTSLAATPTSRAEFLRNAGIGRAAGLRVEAAERLRRHVAQKEQRALEQQPQEPPLLEAGPQQEPDA